MVVDLNPIDCQSTKITREWSSGIGWSKWPYATVRKNMYESTTICKIFNNLSFFLIQFCGNRVFHGTWVYETQVP